MSERKPEYGLLIDYEYCTGCHTCEVACAQEYGWEAGMSGMKVIEVVQKLPHDKAYLAFLPFPTELCVLCARRTRAGLAAGLRPALHGRLHEIRANRGPCGGHEAEAEAGALGAEVSSRLPKFSRLRKSVRGADGPR